MSKCLFKNWVFFSLLCLPAFADNTTGELPLPKDATEMASNSDDKSAHDLMKDKTAIGTTLLQSLPTEWKQSDNPHLNFLELDGYFRVRSDYFFRCDLGTQTYDDTSIPSTSACPSPISYFKPVDALEQGETRSQSLFSTNMRLRIQPTLNVSEDIRIRGTIDVLDNVVLGSTPTSLRASSLNPSLPIPFMATTNLNASNGIINIKRLWGEVSTPIGEFRFGRMPFHFGLGMLFNSGNLINDNNGDSLDGIMLATRLGGFYLIPTYSIIWSGPFAKKTNNWDEMRHIDLDPADNVHMLTLTFTKSINPDTAQIDLAEGKTVFNFGVFGGYKWQNNDYNQAFAQQSFDPSSSAFHPQGANAEADLAKKDTLVMRNAHLGMASLWASFQVSTFHIEAEAAGMFGRIGNTSDLWISSPNKPIWITQGGVALKSRYGLLNNRLQVGLDGGWASGDNDPGFGLSGNQKQACVNTEEKDGKKNCSEARDEYVSNFQFHRDYQVDLLLFREVIGSVTDAFYVKPHISYAFTPRLGLRGDVIASFAQSSSSTPGDNNALGIELDASAFYKSDDGFFVMAQYGVLFPFAGLNQPSSLKTSMPDFYFQYGNAKNAQTFQVFLGITY